MKLKRIFILFTLVFILNLHDLTASDTLQDLRSLEVETIDDPNHRYFHCLNILTNISQEIQDTTDPVKRDPVQSFLTNALNELQKSFCLQNNPITFVVFMKDISISLSYEFNLKCMDPFEKYKSLILNEAEKKNEAIKQAIAEEEQYVKDEEKAIVCTKKKEKILECTQKKFLDIKKIIEYFIFNLQEEDDLEIRLGLQSRLQSLEELSKNANKARSFDKRVKKISTYVAGKLNTDFICSLVIGFLKSSKDLYGNFSATNPALDIIYIERVDLAKREQEILEQIAVTKSQVQTLAISCWNQKIPAYPHPYTPTEEERNSLLDQSLAFFLANDGSEAFTGNLRKNIYFRVERPGGKSALTRQEELSDLKLTLQYERDEAKNYGTEILLPTSSRMGNIVTERTYITTQYNTYVSALINRTKVPQFVKALWGSPPVKVLDIGAANGVNDLELVKMGAIVVANDVWKSLPDLVDFRSRLTAEERTRVCFNTNSFPDYLNLPDDMFDAILMSHVAHYLTGPQFRYGLKKSYRWLKPGAKLFFQSLTPYVKPFHWRPKTTANLLRLEFEWPGWFGQAKKQIEYELGTQADESLHGFYKSSGMPSFGHAIHPEILERELRGAGFEIVYITYAAMRQTFTSPLTYKEHEFYVMGECPDKDLEKKEAYERELARIKVKLSTFEEYRDLLDEDKKSFLQHKTLQYKEKSVQDEIQICKGVIDSLMEKMIYNVALEMLNEAREVLEGTLTQLFLHPCDHENFSAEKFMVDLTAAMLKKLGTDFFSCYGERGKLTPLRLYYNLNGSTNHLASMASVHAIVKKPFEISLMKTTKSCVPNRLSRRT